MPVKLDADADAPGDAAAGGIEMTAGGANGGVASLAAGTMPVKADAEVDAPTPSAGNCCEHGADEYDDKHFVRTAINEFSLTAKLPAGSLSCAVSRIRTTINSYTDRCSQPMWAETFKAPTIKALLRRLLNHGPNLVGHFISDMELAYMQLVDRCHALLSLNKALQECREAQVLGKLSDIISPLQCIAAYFEATEQTLAPDLNILLRFAQVQQSLRQGEAVSDAMRHLDMAAIRLWHKELVDARSADAEMAPMTDDAATGDTATAEAEASGDEEPKAKKRKQPQTMDRGPMVVDVYAEPALQVMRVVVDAVKNAMFKLPKDLLGNDEALEAFVRELARVKAKWEEIVAGATNAVGMAEMLGALRCIFQCCVSGEDRRPRTSAVSEARKVIFVTTRAKNDPRDELAKAMITYDGAKAANAHSQQYASVGLHDSAAVQVYNAAVTKFEAVMGDCWDDTERWLLVGNGGQEFDLVSFARILQAMQTFGDEIGMAIGRWSALALQSKTEPLGVYVATSSNVCHVGFHLGLHTTFKALATVLPGGQDQLAGASSTPPASVKTEPVDDHTGVEAGAASEEQALPEVKVDPAAAATVADASLASLELFKESVALAIRPLCFNFDSLCKRLGQTFSQEVSDYEIPSVVSQMADEVAQALTDFCKYVSSWAFVAKCAVLTEASWQTTDIKGKYMTSLADFSQYQHAFAGEKAGLFNIEVPDMGVRGDVALVGLQKMARSFATTCAAETFQEHIGGALALWLADILDNSIQVASVHDKVLLESAVATILPLLITSPDLEQLAVVPGVHLPDAVFDSQFFMTITHNRSLEQVKQFTEMIGMHTMEGVDMGKAGKGPTNLTIEQGIFVLELVSCCKDIGLVASAVHVHLLRHESKRSVSETLMFGMLTRALQALQNKLQHLEGFLESPIALSIESAGWQPAVPFSVLRQWRASIAILTSRGLATLLAGFSSGLGAKVEACRSACPAWQAAFNEETGMNEQLASKLLVGRSAQIAQHHNVLHCYMSKMNASAKSLSVTPKLTHHEATCEQVAVALATIEVCSIAHVVCHAVELVISCRTDPDGSRLAKEFLDEYKEKYEKNIPSCLWAELENAAHTNPAPSPMSSLSAAALPPPPCASPAKSYLPGSTPIKRRPSWSSASSSTTATGHGLDEATAASTSSGGSGKKAFKRFRMSELADVA